MSVLRRLVPVSLVLLLAALLPAAAGAASFSFTNEEGFAPSQTSNEEANSFGPANHYPGTVTVSGIDGTVTKATLTVLDFSANFDLDMALVGPNGAQVMLMSDACSGGQPDPPQNWTFDESAAEFVPQGTCPSARKTYGPGNYEPEAVDDFGPNGPSGEFSTQLSSFKGISPDGDWKLFLIDDAEGLVGFTMAGFALNLEVDLAPPPAPPGATPPVVVQVPVPVLVPAPAPVVGPQKTGKRAKALAKCKKKKTAEARRQCRVTAKKLPV